MSRIQSRWVLLFVVAALESACRLSGKPQPYETIGKDAEALRAAFNADVGTVRILMLVAPT
jgi:hypothetical protein